MTTPIFQGYKWAAGFDATSLLKSVEVDVPTFQNKPFYVHALGSWDEGVTRIRADKLVGINGFTLFTWTADIMSDEQYNYIQANYTAGGNGLSGKMTVRTINGIGDFANYNAVMRLRKKSDLERIWNAYRNVPLSFVVEEAL